jgi:hypothetical protein
MLFTTILKQTVQMARPVRKPSGKQGERRRLICVRASEVKCEPPSEKDMELKDFLLKQSVATIYMLTAIMYLGRGDFDDFDPLKRYSRITRAFGSPQDAVRQIYLKKPLARYLEDGLTILAKSGIDIDEFMESKISGFT